MINDNIDFKNVPININSFISLGTPNQLKEYLNKVN